MYEMPCCICGARTCGHVARQQVGELDDGAVCELGVVPAGVDGGALTAQHEAIVRLLEKYQDVLQENHVDFHLLVADAPRQQAVVDHPMSGQIQVL